MEMIEAVALFDYNGKTNKELSFKYNQIIYILKKIDSQWWFGYLPNNNQSGYIPDGYFKVKIKHSESIKENFYFNSNNVLPLISFKSINDHKYSISSSQSTSSNLNIDKTLCEILSDIKKHNTPDLVFNLPKKTFNQSKSIVHSTIIIDLKSSSFEQQKKIPPPIMKKPQKTIEFLKRLELYKQSISISESSKVTEV